jgi:hypothetical protein
VSELRVCAGSGQTLLRTKGQKPARDILSEMSLIWALGVILLLWIFAALRACGVTEIVRRVISLAHPGTTAGALTVIAQTGTPLVSELVRARCF